MDMEGKTIAFEKRYEIIAWERHIFVDRTKRQNQFNEVFFCIPRWGKETTDNSQI